MLEVYFTFIIYVLFNFIYITLYYLHHAKIQFNNFNISVLYFSHPAQGAGPILVKAYYTLHSVKSVMLTIYVFFGQTTTIYDLNVDIT